MEYNYLTDEQINTLKIELMSKLFLHQEQDKQCHSGTKVRDSIAN